MGHWLIGSPTPSGRRDLDSTEGRALSSPRTLKRLELAVAAATATSHAARRAEAFHLQEASVAWRRSGGLTPDPQKVAIVDRVVGDLFEGGDYVFPLLHRETTPTLPRPRR